MSLAYSYLDPAKAEIRLLRLLPGEFGEDVKCSLHTVSLNDEPMYEALSYVWGDPKVTKRISVEGVTVDATANLESFLRHLRQKDESRVVWADAICLNQGSDDEKCSQLPLMGRIYRQATSVLVWFGHGDENIQLAIAYMKHKSTNAPQLDGNTLASETSKADQYHKLARAKLGGLKLRTHTYWNRMWTFQEFILNDKPPVCLYGLSSFKISSLVENESIWMNPQERPDYLRGFHEEWSNNAIGNLNNSYTVEKQLGLAELSAQYNSTTVKKYRDVPGLLGPLLLDTVGRQSSHPYDRFFALYGLNPQFSDLLQLDYKVSELELLLRVAEYLIRHELGLNWWSMFSLHQKRLKCKCWPSWILDFNRASVPLQDLLPHESLRRIQWDHHMPSITRSRGLPTFSLWARNLGECHVLVHIGGHIDTMSSAIQTALTTLGEIQPDYPQHKSLAHRFIKLIAMTACFGDESTRAEILAEVYNKVNDTSVMNLEGDDVLRLCELLRPKQKLLKDKTIILTGAGCVGLGPLDTMEGDIALVPPGMFGCIILRKKDVVTCESGHNCYRMVGNADFDTIGQGELHDPDIVENIIEQGMVEYCIH